MKDSEQQQADSENTDHLLDSIETELTELWDTVLPEESLLDDMDPKDSLELGDLDSKIFEDDDSELGLNAPDDLASAPIKIESKDDDARNEVNTSVDTEDDIGDVMMDKEVTGEVSEDTAMVDSGNESASTMNENLEKVVSRLVEKRIYAIAEESAKNPTDGYKQESTAEAKQETDREKAGSDSLTNELADLMSKRIERIVARLLKKQMPVIAEQIILKTMRKILLSMD